MSQHNRHDPLTVLHGDELPVQPDPSFAARLRSRLQSALSLPNRTQGVVMSGTDTAITALNQPAAPTTPTPAALPYLAVADARRAIDWYGGTFDAIVVGEPIVMDDGRIGHAELAIGNGVLYLADEYPELGLKAPQPQAVSVSLVLQVADTDAALERARDHGAQIQREVYENYGSRNATVIDPFGHRWMLSGPVAGAVETIRHGDIGYVSLWTADAERAAAFYGHVLGWRYDVVSHQVTNTSGRIGIFSVAGPRTLFCCYAVTDLQAARQAILDAGGQVDEVEQFDFGEVLGATDSLGTAFAVYQPKGSRPRPALNGTGPGELSYVTFEVRDSGAFRDFYGQVLGWTFASGRVADGWQIDQVRPMSGVAGGSDQPMTVPMWTVADIDAAVARVREAGGTVIDEPSQQSYGKSALCTDDQGARFYLGEF
jgi:predicted enzyme related to lactoylglutathione lyase